jgi:hypothetical protein
VDGPLIHLDLRNPPVRIAFLSVPLLAACTAPDAAPGRPVALLEYAAVAPVTWEAQAPANTMRLAEFVAPTGAGGEPARVVVYYFGPGQGGSADANIQRWTGQFSAPDGGAVTPSVTRLEDATFPTTLVDLQGNYARAVGMGAAPEDATPGQALVAAVVETPRGNLFFQLFGPLERVMDEREAFVAFVRSLETGRAEVAA